MKSSEKSVRPRARAEGLIVKELPDEVLVYDLESHKAHCLNRAAAVIWKHFDGRTSIAEVASRAAGEGGCAVDSEAVVLALQQLRKANLMLEDVEQNRQQNQVTRRDLIKRLGLAATMVPLVTSIIAPTANASASCGSLNCLFDNPNSPDCTPQCPQCIGGKCAP